MKIATSEPVGKLEIPFHHNSPPSSTPYNLKETLSSPCEGKKKTEVYVQYSEFWGHCHVLVSILPEFVCRQKELQVYRTENKDGDLDQHANTYITLFTRSVQREQEKNFKSQFLLGEGKSWIMCLMFQFLLRLTQGLTSVLPVLEHLWDSVYFRCLRITRNKSKYLDQYAITCESPCPGSVMARLLALGLPLGKERED